MLFTGNYNVGWGDTNNGAVASQSMAAFFARSKSAELDNQARPILVERARQLDKSSTIAKAVHSSIVYHSIGSGLILSDIDDELKNIWELKNEDRGFDYQGELDLYQLQQQIIRTVLISGEAFVFRIPVEGDYSKYIVVEPDYFYTPDFVSCNNGIYTYKRNTVIDGIEYNKKGEPKYIWYNPNRYINPSDKNSWQRIKLYNKDSKPELLHVYIKDRPGTNRGLPIISPVIDLVWSTLALTEAEVQMGILQACSAFVIKTDTDKTRSPYEPVSPQDLNKELVQEKTTIHSDGRVEKEYTIAPQLENNNFFNNEIYTKTHYIKPGSIQHLAPGEDVQLLQTNAPNTGLKNFYDLVMEQVGAALRIPKQILTNSYDASYSAAKASFSEFKKSTQIYSDFLVSSVLKPILRTFVLESFEQNEGLSDRVRAKCGVNLDDEKLSQLITLKSSFVPKDPPVILDQYKELDMYIKMVNAGFISREDAVREYRGTEAPIIKQEDIRPIGGEDAEIPVDERLAKRG